MFGQVALIAAVIFGQGVPTVVWDIAGQSARSVGLIGRLQTNEISREVLRVLGSPDVLIGRFVVYASDEDRRLASGIGGVECSYDDWRQVMSELANKRQGHSRCPEVSEALKIGENMVLRAVSSDCLVKTQILQGDNPLIVAWPGGDGEVLGLDIERMEYKSGVVATRVWMPVRTNSTMKTELSKEITRRILALNGGVWEVSVTVRNDLWFFNSCRFPILYPFDGMVKRVIPTKEEYQQGREAYCFALPPWPIGCH